MIGRRERRASGRGVAVVLSAVLWAAAVPAARAQEPSGARVVPLQVTGDAEARFSMVVLGDGYTAADLPKFRDEVQKHMNILWSVEPFRSYRSYFNVYAVEITSPESGITCDPERPVRRNTPLGLNFGGGCENRNARGVNVGNVEAARAYARLATPAYNQILIIGNTDTYGGIGGSVATTTGGNAISPLITVHELGHSLGRLQDEYTYSARGVRGGHYAREEPASHHHTLLTEQQMRERQLKWWRWLGEESESGGPIGRYEGGMSNVSGVWRPSRHSMMISLGYYFDQVGRERMTERINAHTRLIADGTPAEAPVARNQVLWVETPSPVYHELEIQWLVNGQPVARPAMEQGLPAPRNPRHLDLRTLTLGAGRHTVTVRVVDPTPFVRDPAIRDSVLTATRTWTVGEGSVQPRQVTASFTGSTVTSRPLGARDVIFVATAEPGDRILEVSWQLNGQPVRRHPHERVLPLAELSLLAGTHRVSATVTDPRAPGTGGQTLTWTVDATPPRVQYTLSDAAATITRADGVRHYFMRDAFTMRLDPTDDQPGHVVAEFRVNGDGWHHYYGWPDAPPGTPYRFTPSGTVIKELVYGSLSAEGLSPQPWEAREPGWGTHRVEYRAIDAAGNMGPVGEFLVTVMPTPECTARITSRHTGDLRVTSGTTCLEAATVTGSVHVAPGASLFARNATIEGSVLAGGAHMLELVGSTVRGAVHVAGARTRTALFGSRIAGDIVF